MKKTLFIFCLYSTQLYSQIVFERTYLISEDADICFIKPPTNNYFYESIYLLKSDLYSSDNSIAKTGKVDPSKELNPYPDPFPSSINVNIPGNRICNFSLSDMTGGIVFRIEILGEAKRINLSFLPEGIYRATVSGKGDLFSGIH